MEIEVGKEYTVYPKYKKSYDVIEWWKDNESADRCRVEQNYRSCAWIVKVTDEEERERLESYLKDDAQGSCEIEADFVETEMIDYFDECACFFYPQLSEESALSEEWLDEELYDQGTSWFHDNNWDFLDAEMFLGLPMVADPVDPDNRYQTRF